MLVIDVGNSRVKVGVFIGNSIANEFIFDTSAFYKEEVLRKELIDKVDEDAIAFSSVVPVVRDRIISFAEGLKKEWFDVSQAGNKVLKVNYNIKQLGGDRLANAIAAYKKYKPPLLVIDFGTATTYDVVLADGRFDGGIIAPGIKACIDSLVKKTGLLPEISLRYPDGFLGHNTDDAMVSGFYNTFVGQLKEMIAKVQNHIGNGFITVGTGGLLDFALREFPFILPDKDLTFWGIKLLYDANRRQKRQIKN